MIDINWLNDFFFLNGRHNLFFNHLHLFVDRDLYILDYFNFNASLLNDWYIHFLDHLFYLLDLHDPVHNLFNNLRNLNYLLDDPRHHHDLLDYLLHLNDLGYFN
jgi:hypothetical protein